MTRALLYQPNQRWRIGVALGAALLIHLAAVTLANIHGQERIDEVSSSPGIAEIILDPTSPTDDSTPPPDPVAPTPSEDATDKSFTDENPSPPPTRRHDPRPAVPAARAKTGPSGLLTLSSAKVMALSAPRPEYPYEARRQKITGSGFVVMTIDAVTGRVTGAVMEQSTGSPVLDNAAITGFRRWRFRPGTISRVRSPITFTMTGAQY
jgi:periplasmic protein TonB